MLDQYRYWLCGLAVSVLWVAPEVWTAYVIREIASAPEPTCEPVQVDVTCSCAVESEEKPEPVQISGARVGNKQWWEK